MTRVLVGIPWRSQPHRVYAHDLTVQRYRDLLPDADLIDVDTDHEPFSLAACRNRAVRLAEEAGADVAVLADADTLPEPEPLRAAIEAAATDARVHLPYTEYRSLRADGTRQYRDGTPLDRCNHLVVAPACSGVYVTAPATWWAHGGQDERFRGWGMEDVAWLVTHRALLGEPVRHSGRVYALHHESQTKHGPQYDANVALYRRYLSAANDPDAIRGLLGEVNPEKHRLYQAARRERKLSNPGSVGVQERDWRRLVARYRGCCVYCGERSTKLHMDHVIPLSRGGRHAIGNVLPSCKSCNLSKSAKLLAEWRREVMPRGRRT